MKNYKYKWFWLVGYQLWNCAIAEAAGEIAEPTELHHARCADTKPNRRRFPLFIDSVFNLLAVNRDYHMMNPSFGRWPLRKVQWYEDRLAANPELAAWANGGQRAAHR